MHRRQPTNLPTFISMGELTEMLAVTRRAVERWIHSRPGFPQPVRLSKRAIRFRLSEVEAYLAKMQGVSA
jgi:predicted DNA-binding transcriptional regulator AlpA